MSGRPACQIRCDMAERFNDPGRLSLETGWKPRIRHNPDIHINASFRFLGWSFVWLTEILRPGVVCFDATVLAYYAAPGQQRGYTVYLGSSQIHALEREVTIISQTITINQPNSIPSDIARVIISWRCSACTFLTVKLLDRARFIVLPRISAHCLVSHSIISLVIRPVLYWNPENINAVD